ncbi:unnamed protein product [Soboliphyme baturini]|uniref:Uncharacterized protein n=1 Tax=Soboliphyme baturini TaxID=241478 RepID=A0A183J603_9BILA|nr:unnamed protein product [Soboliphyme baturini]
MFTLHSLTSAPLQRETCRRAFGQTFDDDDDDDECGARSDRHRQSMVVVIADAVVREASERARFASLSNEVSMLNDRRYTDGQLPTDVIAKTAVAFGKKCNSLANSKAGYFSRGEQSRAEQRREAEALARRTRRWPPSRLPNG